MDLLQIALVAAIGLCSIWSTWACNSSGVSKCHQQIEKKINAAEDFCSIKDKMVQEFKSCVEAELKGCHPGVARPQIQNRDNIVAGYDEMCGAPMDEEEEEEEDFDDWDLPEEKPANTETTTPAEAEKRALPNMVGAALGAVSSEMGLCESAGPSNCAKDLNKALDPYIQDIPEFCKRVTEVLAVYRACVEAVISGCHVQTQKAYRDNMKTHIEGYAEYINHCNEEGCPDLETREAGMDECADNSELFDAEDDASKCRALKAEAECAWRHAAGCEETEELFHDSYEGMLNEYNKDYYCGIRIGNVVPPATTPPSTTPVPTKPAMENCLALKERACFPPEGMDAKEALEDVVALLQHLGAIHEGKKPTYQPICQVFARMFNFDGKVECTVGATRECFGPDFLKGFDPVTFSKDIKKHCLSLNIAAVQECFH